jgi:cytoskeletal protein CcmA (bactofilin family)
MVVSVSGQFVRFRPVGQTCTTFQAERKDFAMWKPNQSSSAPTPEPVRPAQPSSFEATRTATPSPVADQAVIGKALVVKGEISGGESLLIEGKVEGNITLPGNRVTIGRNGQVSANVSAREIIVLGKVRGNVTATDRVDIRSEGSLTGDVSAARISIEDGAFFKGGIDIKKPGDTKAAAAAESSATAAAAAEAAKAE